MSLKAKLRSELATTSAGSSPSTIRQKRHSSVMYRSSFFLESKTRARAELAFLPGPGLALCRPLQLGVEVVEASGGDPAGFDEAVDILFFEADHAPEFVRGQSPLVDEAVETAKGDSEVLSRLFGAHPVDPLVHHASRAPEKRRDVTIPVRWVALTWCQPVTRRPSSSSRRPIASGVTPKRHAIARRSSARIVIIRPLKSWRCTWIMLKNLRRRSLSGPLTEFSLARSM